MRTHLLLAALLVLSALGRTAVRAEDTDDPGRAMYLRYCGSCHGPGAKGDGIAATVLRPKPSDLTRIGKRQGGFDGPRITTFVDGTKQLRAHGSKNMPIWGEVLHDDSGSIAGSKTAAQSKLMLITEYLRSIQAK